MSNLLSWGGGKVLYFLYWSLNPRILFQSIWGLYGTWKSLKVHEVVAAPALSLSRSRLYFSAEWGFVRVTLCCHDDPRDPGGCPVQRGPAGGVASPRPAAMYRAPSFLHHVPGTASPPALIAHSRSFWYFLRRNPFSSSLLSSAGQFWHQLWRQERVCDRHCSLHRAGYGPLQHGELNLEESLVVVNWSSCGSSICIRTRTHKHTNTQCWIQQWGSKPLSRDGEWMEHVSWLAKRGSCVLFNSSLPGSTSGVQTGLFEDTLQL